MIIIIIIFMIIIIISSSSSSSICMTLGIHYRGVQWEGGAVDWGSIIQQNSV